MIKAIKKFFGVWTIEATPVKSVTPTVVEPIDIELTWKDKLVSIKT